MSAGTITVEDRTIGGVPDTAYRVHEWTLSDWERTSHPSWMTFKIVRGEYGAYDGYILPADSDASAYVLGWIEGRISLNGATP